MRRGIRGENSSLLPDPYREELSEWEALRSPSLTKELVITREPRE